MRRVPGGGPPPGRAGRMMVGAVVGLSLLSSAVSVAVAGGAATARATPGLVRARDSVPALPPGSTELGALPARTTISFDVALRPRDPAALQSFDAAVSTPGSPSFRHFLAPGRFASVFGSLPSTVAATRRWLTAAGLRVGPTSPDGLLVAVRGPVPAVASAFGVHLARYRLPSGRVVRVPSAEPLVPTALAPALQGIIGLDDLGQPAPQLVRRPSSPPAPAPSAPAPGLGGSSARPGPHTALTADPSAPGCAGMEGAGGYTADELAKAYSFSSLAQDGAGVTIGVYELEPYLTSDIDQFESCYTPPITAPVSTETVDGGPGSGAGSGEAALDIEMAVGMAPAAAVKVYEGPLDASGSAALDVYAAMVNDPDPAQVLTTSWGECEPLLGTAQIEAEATLFEQAVAQGQTVIAAAGDEGSQDCFFPEFLADTDLAVDDPASQPWVTGVGGTTLQATGPPPTEAAWNDGVFEGAGGGGNSSLWTMPSWQTGPGVDNSFTLASKPWSDPPCPLSSGPGTVACRQVPDVAADGDPNTGYATYCSCAGGWQVIGGTSMGAPLWGAVVALADQTGAGPARLGLINPSLYQAGCLASPPFNDVTTGTNQPDGDTPSNAPAAPAGPYYPAGPHYDLASGLGTPVASALVPDLQNPVDSCPQVSSASATSGPATGGTVVTLSGANLAGVSEVDFGDGNPGTGLSVSPGSVTVTAPPSPTGGDAYVPVVVKTADDVLGLDGSMYFQYVFPGRGYWMVGSDGGIFAFGAAAFHGSVPALGIHIDNIVGIAPTPDGGGYWMVGSDGGVFAFGDDTFHGSVPALGLRVTNVVGIAPTPDGGGYWMVGSDGGIFAFGDAAFAGSMGGRRLAGPVVAIAAA